MADEDRTTTVAIKVIHSQTSLSTPHNDRIYHLLICGEPFVEVTGLDNALNLMRGIFLGTLKPERS